MLTHIFVFAISAHMIRLQVGIPAPTHARSFYYFLRLTVNTYSSLTLSWWKEISFVSGGKSIFC